MSRVRFTIEFVLFSSGPWLVSSSNCTDYSPIPDCDTSAEMRHRCSRIVDRVRSSARIIAPVTDRLEAKRASPSLVDSIVTTRTPCTMASCFTYEITVRRVTRISRFASRATLSLRFINFHSLRRTRDKLSVRASPGVRGREPHRASFSLALSLSNRGQIVGKENERSVAARLPKCRVSREWREKCAIRTARRRLRQLRRSGSAREVSFSPPSVHFSFSLNNWYIRARPAGSRRAYYRSHWRRDGRY